MDASAEAPSTSPGAPWLERWHARLLVLPALVLAWPGPGAPLGGELLPELSGAAWGMLLAIPAGLALVARGAFVHVPLAWAYAGFLLVGLVAARLAPPTDTLEASRAGLLALATLIALAGGAGLWEAGRRVLARWVVVLALLLAAPAVLGLGAAGALGNVTSTSEAALAGAVLAACLLGGAASAGERALYAATVALFAFHAGRAPVLASALAFTLALGARLLFARGARGGALAALVLALAAGLGGHLSRPAAPSAPLAADAPARDLGGVAVRLSVARASLAMLAEHPLLGVGRGQFAAAFPPWRELEELEASSLGRTPGLTTEVEHPHDDWLAGVLETGLLGGLLWLVFLVAVLVRALRGLRAAPGDAALACASLALLAAALVRGTLLWNPVSATVAFALFGTVLAPPDGERERCTSARVGLNLVLLLVAFNATRAAAVVRHGRALARTGGERSVAARALEALEACPDSVLARSLYARFGREDATGPGDDVSPWRRVLELRPERYEAWVAVGNAYARAELFDDARAAFERAGALDPGDPTLLKNRARLEVRARDAAAALPFLERLQAIGRLPAGWHEGAAVDALQRVDPEGARALLAHAHPDWNLGTPEHAWQLSETLEESAPELARALGGLAQLEWARQHVAAGDPATAVRNYRQALGGLAVPSTEQTPSRAAPVLRLELAAALLRAGRDQEAEAQVARAAPAPADLPLLPSWAGDELVRAGLLDR